jgi:nitrogen fixation NifU-like protein
VGLGAAVDYLTGLGMDNVHAHEQRITAYALDRLQQVEGLRIIGPATTESRGAAVSCALGDLHPHDVGQVLDELGIAVRVGHHCARPVCLRYAVPATTRASFYLYNTEAEVDALRGRRPVKLESMYQEIILDHYRTPHHKGLRDPFDAEVHHVNPTCGDEVTLRVRLGDDGRTIEDVSYESLGCSISMASVSVMTDLVVGKPLDDADAAYNAFLALMRAKGDTEALVEADEELLEDAVAFEGVSKYPARIKCALLGWMAWKDATAQAVAQHDLGMTEESA